VLELEAVLPEIETATGRVEHFAFGGLRAMQWRHVMVIRTRHHLKIIDALWHSGMHRREGTPRLVVELVNR